jgi:folylpolyglutamate synthase/dihydropteroate synthase
MNVLKQADDVVISVPFTQPENMPWVTCVSPISIPGATPCASLMDALNHRLSQQFQFTVICGSLYLISDLFRLFPELIIEDAM